MKKINLIIFGGSSEIAKKIISKYKMFNKIFVFSSNKKNKIIKTNYIKYYFVQNYKISKIKKILKEIMIPKTHILLFMGKNDNKLFNTMSEKEIDQYLKINLIDQIKITNCLLKNYILFKPNIYVFSSTFVNIKSFSSPIYSSSKLFLENIFKSISVIYNKLSIKLSVIKIGLVEGGLKKRINYQNEKLLYKYQKNKKINLETLSKNIIKILYEKRKKSLYRIY